MFCIFTVPLFSGSPMSRFSSGVPLNICVPIRCVPSDLVLLDTAIVLIVSCPSTIMRTAIK